MLPGTIEDHATVADTISSAARTTIGSFGRGSGLQAVVSAAQMIQTGDAEVVLAGGAPSR